MLDSVKERALYGDSYFPEVNRRSQIVAEGELVASKATWHRICYQQTTNNESERESERDVLKSTRDFAIAEAEIRDESLSDELRSLFDAVKILTKAVIDSVKWEFAGDFTNASEKHVINSYTFSAGLFEELLISKMRKRRFCLKKEHHPV